MFNNNERDNMNKTILVVEIIKLSDRHIYNIKKSANSLDKASEYLVALNNLNDDSNVTYELFNRLGQFDVERIEKVEEKVEVANVIR